MTKSRFLLVSLIVFLFVSGASAQTRSFIRTNEYVGVWWNDSRGGDFLVSPSKTFHAYITYAGRFAVYKGPTPWQSYGQLWQIPAYRCCVNFVAMQGDGNLVAYLGSDPGHNDGYIWGTQRTGSGGQFFTVLQDDGNLCTYKGTGPTDQQGFVWCSMATAPVTWAAGRGYILVNGSGQAMSYGGNPMPAWGLAVSMQGPDPSRRWAFEPDGTLRWSSNNACLQLDPQNGATGLVACNGSASQRGWYYQASDRTIRNSGLPAGCLTSGPSPLYSNSSPVPNFPPHPCAGGAASTWTLEGDHPN
jgi:hypothetical protein